jgi:hypothetical protein
MRVPGSIGGTDKVYAATWAALLAVHAHNLAADHQIEVVTPSGQTFVLAASGQPFTPWGLPDGNAGRLVEDFWNADWTTVAGDFRDRKDLGADVVRVHHPFGKFLDGPDRPKAQALARLGTLLDLAEKTGLYST